MPTSAGLFTGFVFSEGFTGFTTAGFVSVGVLFTGFVGVAGVVGVAGLISVGLFSTGFSAGFSSFATPISVATPF